MESERIANGKVETEAVLEFAHIVVGRFACVVGGMNAYTEVETEDEELEVVADTKACAHCHGLEETTITEATTRVLVIAVHEPHIACIEEECALKGVDQGETILGIHLQLGVARLVKVSATPRGVLIATRADAAHGEGTDAVGTADVEEFAVRGVVGVAISPNAAHKHTGGHRGLLRDVEGVLEGELELEELRIRGEEQFLVFLIIVEPEHRIRGVEEIA